MAVMALAATGDPHNMGPCWCGQDHWAQQVEMIRWQASPMSRREAIDYVRQRITERRIFGRTTTKRLMALLDELDR